MWSQLGEGTTISSLRQPPQDTTIHDVATLANDSPQTSFYAKLAQLAYKQVLDRPSYILNDILHYDSLVGFGTLQDMSNLSETNRRVLYEKADTGIESIATYIPINVESHTNVPIYVIFRGTDSIWDVFKDLNLLFDYGTGSAIDLTGINTLVVQIINYLTTLMSSTIEDIVFISHSLGSQIALNVLYTMTTSKNINNSLASRITKSIMFNPFIVVDNTFTESLSATQNIDYQNKFEAHIIDGDFASIIYKNHPIGSLTVYGNIVPENSWIDEIQTLTRQQYLNVTNHALNQFTGGVDTYPTHTYVHYDSFGDDLRQIVSLRTYSLHQFDDSLNSEHIYLKKAPEYQVWKVGNINIDSQHINYYNLKIRIAGGTAGKKQMIWKNGYWSYPLEFGVENTFDVSNVFYLYRAYNENSEQTYYMVGIFNNLEWYYRTKNDTDYSQFLKNQDNNGLDAMGLSTLSQLQTAQARGQVAETHKSYRWLIQSPSLPSHANYNNGTRRVLSTMPYNWKPINNSYYRIRLAYYLTDRYLAIYRNATGVSQETGVIAGIHKDSTYLSVNNSGDIFKCIYDAVNDTYKFLDYDYLQANATNSLITDQMEVYIGENNLLSAEWSYDPSTNTGNHIEWKILENTPANVTWFDTNVPRDDRYFTLKNATSNHYLYIQEQEWSAQTDPGYDYAGSVDPMTGSAIYAPSGAVDGLWSLFKFEQVEVGV